MKIIENINTNKTEYSRLVWKSLAIVFLLGLSGMTIAWRIESYGRKMDAQVSAIRLEFATKTNATGSTTTETTLGSTQDKKNPTGLGKTQ